MSLVHLPQVHESLPVAQVEVNALVKEHRCVAVGVESNIAEVEGAGPVVERRLGGQPCEERVGVCVAPVAHPFRVPLDTDDGLEVAALHRLDDAVGREGHGPEVLARAAYSLMVEGIDHYPVLAVDAVQQRVGLNPDGVRRCVARSVLFVLYMTVGVGTGTDVLDDITVEGRRERLYAAADAEHGHAATVGGARQEELGGVALRIDGAEAAFRFLGEVERIDVSPAGEHQSVDALERRQDVIGAEVRRQEHGRGAGGGNALIVRLGEPRLAVLKVGRKAYHRARGALRPERVEQAQPLRPVIVTGRRNILVVCHCPLPEFSSPPAPAPSPSS